jgi:hypothetical protein
MIGFWPWLGYAPVSPTCPLLACIVCSTADQEDRGRLGVLHTAPLGLKQQTTD